MRTKLSTLTVILCLLGASFTNANAVGYATCVAFKDTQVVFEYGDAYYELNVVDQCESGVRSYSFTFQPNKTGVFSVSQSNVIIHSYGQKLRFKITGASPGEYSPTLIIASSQDRERRTIAIPRFQITDPIDCIEIVESRYVGTSTPAAFIVKFQNTCNEYGEYSFTRIYPRLRILGLTVTTGQELALPNISRSGSEIRFGILEGISGVYTPEITLKSWSTPKNRDFSLSTFSIDAKVQPKVTSKSVMITCTNGVKNKRVTGTNPKCPSGYKVKR